MQTTTSKTIAVAEAILDTLESKSCELIKLHALMYYVQGWSLAWSNQAIFPSEILATTEGPIVEELQQLIDSMGDHIDKDNIKAGDLFAAEAKSIQSKNI